MKDVSFFRRLSRGNRGEMMTEFASALTILICFLLLPLLNLAAVPIRYIISFAMVSNLTHKLSLAEKRSQAVALAAHQTAYHDFANKFGITMGTCNVYIICKNQKFESIALPANKPIPPEWLPGGFRGQSNYFLQTETDMQIAPFVCFTPKIPGMSSPIQVNMIATTPWENLGLDPATQGFYLNE
jgi:hypothetical protein